MNKKSQQPLLNYMGLEMRECSICHEAKIPSSEPAWKTFCRACYAKSKDTQPTSIGNGNRVCEKCGQAKIKAEDPAWKKNCYDCWKSTAGEKKAETFQRFGGQTTPGYAPIRPAFKPPAEPGTSVVNISLQPLSEAGVKIPGLKFSSKPLSAINNTAHEDTGYFSD